MKAKQKVNNEIYRSMGHAWWNDEVGEFSTLRFWINPVRFSYFMRVLIREKVLDRGQRCILDVGCGGGIKPRRNPIGTLLDFRRRVQGKITFKELGRRLDFQESNHLDTSYMGYARKSRSS
jgi:hypothetical protein